MGYIIPLSTPAMNGTEMQYVKEAFDTNWVAPAGPYIGEFEREIAEYTGVKHAAALASGTAALHLALKAVGVKKDSVVFCSDLTFAASCNPIIYENAVPVFIDSERESWNMCPRALEKAFKKYPRAAAVVVVNLYGTPAKLNEIADICAKHKVPLIEDAAESLGSSINGKQTGSFGKTGVLSFNGNKIITTSGGGMLLCDDGDIADKIRFWSTQARDPARYYLHSELGYNYRMSNICAGIGRGQMNTLDLRVQQKTSIYQAYAKAFAGHRFIRMNPVPPDCKANHWLSCITFEPECRIKPDDVINRLEKENIETRPIWNPMSLQPYYEGRDLIVSTSDSRAVGHDIFNRGLCLPSDVKMTPEQQGRVCDLILDMF